jgi:hypothetical protein
VEFARSVSAADPHNYKAYMQAPDADKWKEACNTEISTLIANGTWELIELSPDAKVINSGWVFKLFSFYFILKKSSICNAGLECSLQATMPRLLYKYDT